MRKGLIKFDEAAHWYSKDGEGQHDADLRVARKSGLYPSVTSVDKATFPNLFLERWKMNQLVLAASENHRQPHESTEQFSQRIYDLSMEKATDAAAFGKRLHDAIEKHPEAPSDPTLLPWWTQFDGWWKASGLTTIESEFCVLDHDIGIAGRCDRVCLHPEGYHVLPDWKTQDVKTDEKGRKQPAYYESWKRQLSVYAVAYAKKIGTFPSIPRFKSVIIDSNENGLIYEKDWTGEEIRLAYRQFIHAAWIWFTSKRPPYWPRGEWSVADIQLPT